MPVDKNGGYFDVITIRELFSYTMNLIADYWCDAKPEYLLSIGVDPAKIPERSVLLAYLEQQGTLPLNEKDSFYFILEINDIPSGHCNITNIVPGEEAYLHVHIWHEKDRNMRSARFLLNMAIGRLFYLYKLKRLYCQPPVGNDVMHYRLQKSDFKFVKECVATPCNFCFEQPVKLWMYER